MVKWLNFLTWEGLWDMSHHFLPGEHDIFTICVFWDSLMYVLYECNSEPLKLKIQKKCEIQLSVETLPSFPLMVQKKTYEEL